jgi:hypothetical protein
VVVLPPVSAPTTAFCRGPLAASVVPIRKPGPCEKSAEKSIKFFLRVRVEFTAASSGLTVLAQGAKALSAVA